MQKIELLAPAGDMQSLKCAVYNGADAVYLGLNDFNARIKADNFTRDNIAGVVNFAHLYGVKVYLTLNTLVKDGEVEDFLDTFAAAYRARVDAFIIQDLGMAVLIKKKYPNAVLHASTQMGIHNLQGAKMLESLGFARVVLSRETKLADIKLIRQNTNLEIEYFVQGALCVAFSGNCYLSAIKNGNSGNRGKCLQLCRLPYTAYLDGKMLDTKYYLSCKDLCLMRHIDELTEAGVISLKIEGRLKRASYVAQTVRSYRKVIGRHISDNEQILKEQKKIQNIFSRGAFNEAAYLFDNFNIINSDINNHEGKHIGKVTRVERFKDLYKITLQLSESVSSKDAIRLISGTDITSIGVGNVNKLGEGMYQIFSTNAPKVGAKVYLLKSAEKEDNLISFERKLPIDMHFEAHLGGCAALIATYGNISAKVQSCDIVAEAKTRAATYEDVYKQVSKLNDTHFVLNVFSVDIDDVFLPVSLLNDLRRRVVEELEAKIISEYNATMPEMVENDISIVRPVINTRATDFVMIDDVTDASDRTQNYIICPREYTLTNISRYIETMLRKGVKKERIYIDLPIMSTTAETDKIEEILANINVGVVINNYSQLALAKQYKAIAGIGMNIYNSYTAGVMTSLGAVNFVQSLEAETFSKSGIVYASGHPTLMTLCHCPIREIVGGECGNCRYTDGLVIADARNNRYKVRRNRIDHCYFSLLSEEMYSNTTKNAKIIDVRKI